VNIQNTRHLTLTVVKGDVICPAFGGCTGAAIPRGRRGTFDPAFLHALNELCPQAEVHAVRPPGAGRELPDTRFASCPDIRDEIARMRSCSRNVCQRTACV